MDLFVVPDGTKQTRIGEFAGGWFDIEDAHVACTLDFLCLGVDELLAVRVA